MTRLLALLLLVAAVIGGAHAAHIAIRNGEWREATTQPQRLRDAPHKFTLALNQPNLTELDAAFRAVSDPQSPRYAEYLSHSELRQMVGVSSADAAHVERVLRAAGATVVDFAATRDSVCE
jgi:subtilase family serine protease